MKNKQQLHALHAFYVRTISKEHDAQI